MARPASGWIERSGDGVDRMVLNEQRIELRGLAVTPVGSAAPALTAGAVVPAWAAGAASARPARYVFWSGRDVVASASFEGELEPIATLPDDIQRAFDWLDGIGVITRSGLFTVRAADRSVRPLPVPGAIEAVAADGRRAFVLTVFGRALLTFDGGASYRDLSEELGGAVEVEVRGGDIAVSLHGGRERFIGPDGAIREARVTTGPRRGEPPPAIDPRWPDSVGTDALEAAVEGGVPLSDGGAVVAAGESIGRVDLETGLTTSAVALPEGSGECAPFRAPDRLLAVCAGDERATVIDLSGAPRIERSFNLPLEETSEDDARVVWRPSERDRFIGVDGEALAYLGPCEAPARRAFDLDAVTGASGYNPSAQKAPALCVRKAPGVWIEHRLDPADATDVVAWVPRRGGGAVALVARPGPFLTDDARIEVRGDLRVVRFARTEPPILFPQYRYGSPSLLARALAAHADGSIEGWLPSQSSSVDLLAVAIDPAGRMRARPLPPRTGSVSTSGPFALAQTDDGRLFETSDFGRRWIEAAPPPGGASARASSCSPVGCRIGPFLRIGWTDPRAALATGRGAAGGPDPAGPWGPAGQAGYAPDPAALRAQREHRTVRRGPVALPITRLRCDFAGAPEGARIPESYGFGVTAAPVPRLIGVERLGAIGMLVLPWNGAGLQVALSGDAELSWLAPFDLAGRVHRVTLSLAGAALSNLTRRPYEAPLGYVLDRDGRVAPIAAGNPDVCLAGLLGPAGVTLDLGACAPQPGIGVDLGDRVVVLSSSYRGQIVSAAERPSGKGAPAAPLRELHVHPVAAAARGFAYGAGLRGGAPVFVAVSDLGEVVLTAVDPERGTFGPEERLAPMKELLAGDDPRCAPRPGEARVVLPLGTQIGLARGALPGLVASGSAGLAVIRWSASGACLDAVEIGLRDERYEMDLGAYDPAGTVKKLVARFAGPSPLWRLAAPRAGTSGSVGRIAAAEGREAALIEVTYGQEVRQRLVCRDIAP